MRVSQRKTHVAKAELLPLPPTLLPQPVLVRMLYSHVLEHTTQGTVGLAAAFDFTMIVPLDFS